MQHAYTRNRFGLLLALLTITSGVAPWPVSAQSVRDRQLAARDHVNQGNYLMGQNKFQEAVDQYKQALEIDPTNNVAKDNIITCHINWGNYFVRQRKFNEALKEYQMCLQLNPYNSKALNNINVVKATIARETAAARARGENPEAEQEDDGSPQKAKSGAAAAKKEQPSAVLILTPGIKQSSSSSNSEPPATGRTDSSAAGSEARSLGAGETPPPVQPTSTPPPPSEPPSGPAAPANKVGPAAAGLGTLEDSLAAVEIKIYGRKQVDLPVFKRLEKLEMDSLGQARTGTIKERIDFLRKNYGL